MPLIFWILFKMYIAHFQFYHYFCSEKQFKIHSMAFKDILRKINNRYVYVTIAFLVIILFVDQFNVFEQIKLHQTLKDQKEQIEYYKQEISNSEKLLDDLQHDSIVMEKTARENYMMKRDDEVVYLLEEK